ncbi:MAG: thioredoxin [Dehalococcoidales bacterium]|nr:thioredoxin [Dehalococcoidales bacterium]
MVKEINDIDFEKLVIKSTQPVLVDMWATWCVPCKMVAPVVEKLSGKYAGKVQFYKMDIDANPKTTASFRVMSIPTLLLFKNGKVADMVVGAVPERTLASHIDAIL